MAIYEHFSEYAGLPVQAFGPDSAAGDGPPPAAESVAWRVGTEFDEAPFAEVFERFLDTVDTTRVTALLVGYWSMSYDQEAPHPVASLVAAADRFPGLRALFLGDIVMEEAEISWIEQTDITPLLTAFPRLERFGVRGGGGRHSGSADEDPMLRLQPFRSEHLRELRIETGGLPAGVVRAVAASDLPSLEHLELWIGDPEYGGDATVDDLAPILAGERLPALRHLGLQNAEIQDKIMAAVATAAVVPRLESLDLSMGVLTDAGAEALLSGQSLTHLRRLDLRHHYLDDAMVDRVRAALPGVAVDIDGQQDPDGDYRFVAVAE